MSKSDKIKSLEFYAYLCQKVGSEDIVRSRRLIYTIGDIAMDNNFPRISSGSKGEGLNFKGSDTDLMFIEPDYRVCESVSDVTDCRKVILIMDTDETPPCFTYLHILASHGVLYALTEQMWQQKNGKMLLSSELFKTYRLRQLVLTKPTLKNLHGPCISDDLEQLDVAYCIKCEKWISQAQPWVSRPHAHHFVSEIPTMHCRPPNKLQYFEYKHYISQLLIGVNSDALSGWLLLATFFYSHKHYREALIITDHVMSKFTDKTIPVPVETSGNIVVFHEIHDYVMELMKHEKTTTIVKNLTNLDININTKSLAILPELQQDIKDPFTVFSCKPMSYFIQFLSYYHLKNVHLCNEAMRLLRENLVNFPYMNNRQSCSVRTVNELEFLYKLYFLGISAQMMGEKDLAKRCFRLIAKGDIDNCTSAASRLSELS
ncbi:unnamed protein product [Mytilus coruscus]|uniref:Mab-21-like HhH/H2TH-like domain-containing protein n=1 Tax=Mytilus coruscus TaxID=42192 RepID=A0A6J8A0Q9_MYTCO|nr:unnamed protein product [Mytilus coruscus]